MKERDVVGEAIAEDAADKAAAGVRRWQMVPVEPTKAMLVVASLNYGGDAEVYRSMLAAAPQPPALKGSSMTIGSRMIGLINAFERAVQVNCRTPAKHANKADTLARVETARARLTKAIEIVSGAPQ